MVSGICMMVQKSGFLSSDFQFSLVFLSGIPNPVEPWRTKLGRLLSLENLLAESLPFCVNFHLTSPIEGLPTIA
jgi:hypothetical protein